MSLSTAPALAPACFVVGTDTGVGKSRVSAALLHSLARDGRRVVGMKPVAAGAAWLNGVWTSDDAVALRAASNVAVPTALDNPVLLDEPLSPHLAAARMGRQIRLEPIVAACNELRRRADAVVVEGAGGLMVPLSATLTGLDLAQALSLPLVLVVGLRLGCLNHALLTAAVIRQHGLTLAGWVANRIDPQMAGVDENIAYLRQHLSDHLGAPLLADLAWSGQPESDVATLAIDLPAGMRR
ncbi:MAG: dethiobiotin synthase [Leptothrix sp. (in: b-proteobacteria)]